MRKNKLRLLKGGSHKEVNPEKNQIFSGFCYIQFDKLELKAHRVIS